MIHRLICLSGFLAVVLGAFGAHALKSSFSPEEIEIWKTATFYHLTHSIVALVALHIGALRAASFLVTGALVFGGSLYLLSVTGVKWLGAVTPIGGGCLLAGWLLLAFSVTQPVQSNR